jgi:hypothetical protein
LLHIFLFAVVLAACAGRATAVTVDAPDRDPQAKPKGSGRVLSLFD